MAQYTPSSVETLDSMESAAAAHADLCDLLHECVATAGQTNPTNCHGRMMMLRCSLVEAVTIAESLCPEDVRALPLQ